ncbi:unnamed protein product [Strongylus vulgaris]|uniref:Major facilitator superfamily (MFS) profile domain-containing protein n=1 Tax=Strongylus vulgaris TaxID=40348 RepID=A0A3P7J7Q1_STRVU|nr:unnamed protein product [Strongylus vulgaris]
MSIYFMSTWQYLTEVDSAASMDFFGWVVAAGSLGCAIANPLFGHWSQLTGSTKTPVCFGFIVSAVGNLIYALLPALPLYAKWAMLISRFATGFGAGTLGVLRSFVATASTRKSRIRAVSLGTAGFTSGLSVGPAFQICFIPLGNEGFNIGPLVFNMYTAAAYFMCIVSILSVFVVQTFFVEDYVGIISDEEKKEDPFLVIPKYDRIAVTLLFYMWWMLCGVASTEGDRRLVLALGLSGFFFCHLCHYPMPFYEGPLTRPQIVFMLPLQIESNNFTGETLSVYLALFSVDDTSPLGT